MAWLQRQYELLFVRFDRPKLIQPDCFNQTRVLTANERNMEIGTHCFDFIRIEFSDFSMLLAGNLAFEWQMGIDSPKMSPNRMLCALTRIFRLACVSSETSR